MKPAKPLALTLVCVMAFAHAQSRTGTTAPSAATFTDPANLGDERVKPVTGRELPIDQGTAGVEEMLRRLNTRASLMLIVAHPDDEDGGMLTLYARGMGARVADLSLTRGEGGQNAMTGDFEDALGLLRTQELLSADRYSGVDQFFGTEVDFGFSKTKEEAFRKWGHERVLYDVVRAIRIYRPLVLASTWIGDVTDGHGQHQVSGEITQEAFKAAGDPNVFPELTKEGILPWQPMKVYARVPMQAITDKGLFDYATNQYVPASFTNYVTGAVSSTPPTVDVTIHEGTPDPLLTPGAANPEDLSPMLAKEAPSTPLTYVQFARIGLGLQKSQIGPGVRNPPAGRFDVSYHLYGSKLAHEPEHEASFFDGIDTSVEGIAGLAPDAPRTLREGMARLSAELSSAQSSFSAANPAGIAPALAEAAHQEANLIVLADGLDRISPEERADLVHELKIKQAQTNDALALALGLRFDATSSATELNTNEPVKLASTLQAKTSMQLSVTEEHAETAPGGRTRPEDEKPIERTLTADHSDHRTLTLLADETLHMTRPYFFRKDIEQPVYALHVPELRNAPASPPALVAWATVDYRGSKILMGRVVHHAEQPARFVPPLSLSLSSSAQVMPASDRPLRIAATLRTTAQTAPTGKLLLSAPAAWTIKPVSSALHAGTTSFTVMAPAVEAKPIELSATARTANGDHISEGYRPVGYGDLPRTDYFTPAIDRIVPVDLKMPALQHGTTLRIGYLPGTGDAVPEALASIGLAPVMLTVADLTPEKLRQFDTVILGVRTYSAHPELHGAPTRALIDFARGGGNVVVQYQTLEFTGADAPYPLSLGANEKVVDETAPVKLLDPASPMLSAPNRITPADFNGWIEERGHGFLSSWDEHYTALTETHDPGAPSEHVAPQQPQRGGLITTRLGDGAKHRGRWTYVAFAIYRQLPEAVPGAYRLFINLISPPNDTP
jgi:LmbE family N-acetylglucosaminyl deacetylase